MAQVIKKLKPITVNTDTSRLALKETESSFIRGYEIAFGKDGKSNEGGNFGVGKKMASNYQTIPMTLPATGINKTIGFYESKELNEAYVFNYNSLGSHGIYRLDGKTLTCDVVAIKQEFNFSYDPKYSIPEHRCTLRVVYGVDDNGQRIVIAKYLIFTNGLNWQNWVDVIASIATGGFDPVAFPYYKLQPPHFDANELIEYIGRPPMYAPVVSPVAPTLADVGLENFILKKCIQFAYRAILTDGRATALSWYSTPYYTETSTCDADDLNTPRCVDLLLDAGSPLVERYQILVRYNGISATNGIAVNTDWALYDTINKFSTDGDNDPSKIGNQYWTRTNPWANYNYDPVNNKITYRFCGDKGTTIFSPDDAVDFVQNDVPLKSCALSNTGDVLIWGNNLRFYPNLPQSTLDNISLDVVDGSQGAGACGSKTVKITLYATFDGAVVSYQTSSLDNQRHFCRTKINVDSKRVYVEIAESNKFFLTTNNLDGLVCYLAGTSYYSVGVQYKVDAAGNKTKIGVIDETNSEQMTSIFTTYQAGGFIMQQFDFSVPAGHYLARLCRHNTDITADYELTSTYVRGIAQWPNIISSPTTGLVPDQNIEIDASNGDVDTWTGSKEIFYLFCPYTPLTPSGRDWYVFPYGYLNYSSSWRFIEGYLRDNIDGISGIDTTTTIGIERVRCYASNGTTGNKVDNSFTDNNGFFFAYSAGGDANKSEVVFDAQFNCGAYTQRAFRTQINQGSNNGYFPGQIINISDVNAAQGNYILITGKVISCASGKGISSVGVTIKDGHTYYTDSDGLYSLRFHTLAGIGNPIKTIYVNSNGNCLFSNCDCTIVSPFTKDVSGIPCSNSERIAPAVADIQLKNIVIDGSSLKGGGRYPIYITGHDLGGRKAAPSLIGYLDVPTFLEKGNFNTSKGRVTITGDLNLPSWVKWVTFSFGANINSSVYLQWVGDKIEYLDNKGNVTADGNGAIRARITIQSLLDFNIKENFATTATYSFVQGDRLRVYDDGQGNLFDPASNGGYLDYQVLGTNFNDTVDPSTVVTTAVVTGGATTTTTTTNSYDPRSFIIEYDERLLALKDKCGFWIELNRTAPQIDNEPAFGIAGTYPVINGEIQPTSIILDAFDTFFQKRNIIISACSGANLNHPFESQSITDYWGDNVTSAGVVLFKDPLAQQRWYLNDAIKTDALVNNGRVNGLGTCRSANRKDFTDQDWGGIVAIHSERNILAFVCENDWFTADFKLNYANVDQYGRIIANADLATGIGNPYQKVGDNFGCAYEDISSIKFNDGIAIWMDRKNSAVVIMNYRQAVDISLTENKGYFINKFKYMVTFNNAIQGDLNNIIETAVGINPNNNQLYFSFRPRNGMSTSPVNFVNNEGEVNYGLAETFVYNIDLKKWVHWTPYVPEYYGSMGHAQSGNEFITFVNGAAWFHNSKATKGFMNFYGVDTDQVFNACLNFDPSKLKIYQAIAIESPDVKYFIRKIETDDPGLISYLTLAGFEKRGNVWYRELLRNMNTYPDPNKPVVSMLQDGKGVYGNFMEIQLVSDPQRRNDYSEINNILVRFIGEDPSGDNNNSDG